ncbi:MAG: T9SS type A sorting domain-containing protein [Chitinophagales bacterium]|nr:T9SS type A sorting domain-containing protein [Chitinophagales bacterium]
MIRSLSFMTLFVAVALLFSYTEVYTNSANPPDDHAGAPPSNITCAKSGCHAGTPTLDGSGLILITADSGTGPQTVDDNFLYRLGTTYDINITLQGNKSRYGFQMTMLDAGFVSPGSWTVASSSSTTANIASPGSKRFFEHKSAGTTNSWTLEWTAPSTDPGPIGIYTVGNFANNNGTSSGDSIYRVSHTINAIVDSMPSGFNSLTSDPFNIEVYPNPIVDGRLNFVYTNLTNDIMEIQLFDQSGRVVQYIPGDVANGTIHKNIELNTGLTKGVYFLSVTSATSSSVKRIVLH